WSAPRAPAAQRRGTQSWLLRLPASGGEATRARRDFDPRPAQSSSHLREKLLEQSAKLERRPLAAIAHDRRRDGALAIDLPAADRRAVRSRIAPRAGKAALSLLAGSAALTLACQQLPARTRAGTGRVLEREEARAVESGDVETTIAHALVERAARGDGLAVA